MRMVLRRGRRPFLRVRTLVGSETRVDTKRVETGAADATPLALDARGCAELFGVSVRHWRAMDSAGMVPRSVRLGAAVRWRVADLRRWLEQGCPGRARFEATMSHGEGLRA